MSVCRKPYLLLQRAGGARSSGSTKHEKALRRWPAFSIGNGDRDGRAFSESMVIWEYGSLPHSLNRVRGLLRNHSIHCW